METDMVTKSYLTYAAGTLLSQATGFSVAALLARSLTTRDYATYGLLATTTALGPVILTFGLVPAIFRFWEHAGRRAADTALTFVVISSAAILGLAALFRPAVESVLGLAGRKDFFVAVGLILFSEAVSQIPLSRMRVEGRASRYSGILIMKAIIIACGAAVTVVLNRGIEAMVVALLLSSVAGALAALFATRVTLTSVQVGLLKKMLSFGLPLQPAILLNFLLSYADRYVFAAVASLTALAPYVAASSLVGGVNAAASAPFALLWPPLMYRMARGLDGAKVIAATLTLFFSGTVLINSALALMAGPLMSVYAPAYSRTAAYVPLLALSYSFFAVFVVANSAFQLATATRVVLPIMVAGTCINLFANLLLIPRLGGTGAAIANLLGYSVIGLGSFRASSRLYYLPYEWRSLGIVCSIGVVSTATATLQLGIGPNAALLTVCFGLAVLCLRPVVLEFHRLIAQPALRDSPNRQVTPGGPNQTPLGPDGA